MSLSAVSVLLSMTLGCAMTAAPPESGLHAAMDQTSKRQLASAEGDGVAAEPDANSFELNPAESKADFASGSSLSAPSSFRKDPPRSCVAIRGNGELIMAHFNSLAHLVEHYGLYDGLAGGSSGSVSIFIYESIIQNPALWDCPKCTKQDTALRASLLLKTLWAYFDVVRNSEDAKAVFDLAGAVGKLQKDFKAKGLANKLKTPGDAYDVARRLTTLLEDSEITGLINPDILKMLKQVTGPQLKLYQVKEVQAAIATFGQFKAEDKKIFFRPGLISFSVLAERFGRVGNFYAGRGGSGLYDHAGVKHFLDTCAPGSMDLSWRDLKTKEPKCGQEAFDLIHDYRAKLLAAGGKIPNSRLNDKVGKYAHILVATGILEKPEAAKWREGLKRYRSNVGFDEYQFKVFDQLRFGYWGQESDLEKVAMNPEGFTDLKTSKRLMMAAPDWHTALTYSAAEPGLAPFKPMGSTGWVSAAGWTDLSPTLVLRNMGCQKVTYITRQGDCSPFGRGVAKNIGMSDSQDRLLYSLENPQSSYSQSLRQADGVWCTNWNTYPVQTNLNGMDLDSYDSPMESDKAFKMVGFAPYRKLMRSKHRGCGGMAPVEADKYPARK